MQPSARSTRVITLVAPQKHEHARWALALDEAKSWKEEVEKEVRARVEEGTEAWVGPGKGALPAR